MFGGGGHPTTLSVSYPAANHDINRCGVDNLCTSYAAGSPHGLCQTGWCLPKLELDSSCPRFRLVLHLPMVQLTEVMECLSHLFLDLNDGGLALPQDLLLARKWILRVGGEREWEKGDNGFHSFSPELYGVWPTWVNFSRNFLNLTSNTFFKHQFNSDVNIVHIKPSPSALSPRICH